MELSVCSQDGMMINVHFVLQKDQDQENCSPYLIYAFQACKDHDLGPRWLTTEACLATEPTKKDVFICDPFEGEAFSYLTSNTFKSVRVLGPRCLLTCLHSKKPVPELPSPLHNMALHKLVITSTGFNKEEKGELQSLVEWMSGIYSNNYHEGVTHLLANTVGSKKYMVAIEKGIPIMTGNWIKAVWKAANSDSGENISATQSQFVKYTCPVFLNLNVCVSQFPREEKENLKKLITENGGIYSSNLEMNITSVLIINSSEGEKYKHACHWRIPCLTLDWISDSIQAGHALPMENYKIAQKPKSSTPTNDQTIRGLPDVSICSTIMNETAAGTNKVDETVDADLTTTFTKPRKSEFVMCTDLAGIQELPLLAVMKAGFFLDGCKIFLSGFEGQLNEKLRRILNAGGATRYNHLSEVVSHVIVGKHMEEHHSTIHSWPSKPLIVTPDWIAECVKNERTVDETPFLYASPSEKQRSPPTCPAPKRDPQPETNNETYVDEALIQQYMRAPPRQSGGDVTREDSFNCSTLPDSQQTSQGIFRGKVFTVCGYDEEVCEQLVDVICSNGGEVAEMNYDGYIDYSIITVESEGTLHPRARHCISHLFIEECLEQEKILPVEYYHIPICWPKNLKPLFDCVIATSSYKGKERAFLMQLATLMGAKFQEMFSKKDNPKKGVRSSTHLVCPSAEGEKYKAAKKWGVPTVTAGWLLKSASLQSHVDENRFLVDEPALHEDLDAKAIILGLLKKEKSSVRASVSSPNADDASFLVAPTPIDRKVRALKDLHVDPVAAIRTPDQETIRRLYPTPGRKKSDDLDSMPTPDTPYGLTWFPNPSSRIRKGFKRAIDALPDDRVSKRPLRDPGTPEEVYIKRMTDNIKTMLKNHVPPKPPSKHVNKEPEDSLPSHSAAFSKAQSDDVSLDTPQAQSASITSGPLAGVVAYASRKLSDIQQDLYKTVAELGGDYAWNYDTNVTHFLHQGRPNDTQKEFRLARSQGKIIVAPEWVWMCKDENQRIDEGLFPHFHNPKMSLSLVSIKASSSSRRRAQEGRVEEETQDDDDDNDGTSDALVKRDSEEEACSAASGGKLLSKQLEEIEALAGVTSASHLRKSSATTPKNKVSQASTSPPQPPPASKSSGAPEMESQNVAAIAWDDPQEREARARLQEECTRDTQEILAQMQIKEPKEEIPSRSPIDQQEDLKDDEFEGDDTQVFVQSYIFTLSGMTEDQRIQYSEIIASLDGQMSENQSNFDPSVTHVVTLKPSRSEKHLAAIASGKWILYKSFLDDSLKAGKFVQEEDHEFGNSLSTVNLPSLSEDSMEYKLSRAAHKWRKKLSSTGTGAFHGMKAIFYSSKERVAAFSRLVSSGGGEVASSRTSLEDAKEITHCFVELNKNVKVDLAWFASRGIPCLPPVFLNDFLTRDPPPNEMEESIPEYKKIVHEMT